MKAYLMRIKRESHQAFPQIQIQSFFLDKLKALRLSNVVAQINVKPISNNFDALMTGFRIK